MHKNGTSNRVSVAKDSIDLPRHKVVTKQEYSARIIQTKYRQHRAKLELKRRKEKKKKYEEDMQRLEKAAFDKMVRSEHSHSEKEKGQQRQIIAKREKEQRRIKRMISSSFDGRTQEISSILDELVKDDDKAGLDHGVIGKNLRDQHQLDTVDCQETHGNTPLSEAAAGGHVDTIKLLLDKGANPNTQGQFMRTPLYRAAFAGHTEACKVLLEHGADPRMYAMDNNTPQHISALPSIVELLKNWDISETDRLIEEYEIREKERKEEKETRKQAELKLCEEELKDKQELYEALQSQLNLALCELEKEIYKNEHTMSVGYNRKQKTLQKIQDLQFEIQRLIVKIEESSYRLTETKLKLMNKQANDDGSIQHLPGHRIMVKEIDKVILKDEDQVLQQAGKWPLIIDVTGMAVTHLKYKDALYIDALDTKEMESEKIRKVVITAIRYGMPLVLDMMEVDMLPRCREKFDHTLPGLLNMIMDKQILQPDNFMKLVKDSDGTDFQRSQFTKVDKFKLMITTKNQHPSAELTNKTFIIRIYVPLA